MYEQVAKDKVKETLKQGVESQQVHQAINRGKISFPFGDRIVAWFKSQSRIKRPLSREERNQTSEPVNLAISEKTS
jgi:hypothetical protein